MDHELLKACEGLIAKAKADGLYGNPTGYDAADERGESVCVFCGGPSGCIDKKKDPHHEDDCPWVKFVAITEQLKKETVHE